MQFELSATVLGTIAAAVIAATVSLLGLIIAKENKVSEFRQAWIDNLRDEISLIISHANELVGLQFALRSDTKN